MNNSKKAGLLSLLFMGLGQLVVTKEYVKAAVFMIIEVLTLLSIKTIITNLHGLITLGTITGYTGVDMSKNDHSIKIMIAGIITVFICLIVLLIYIANLNDAIKSGRKLDAGGKPVKFKEFIHNFWDRLFPYITMSPALLLVCFFIVLPLIFGLLLAFTNYSAPNYVPPKSLISWVGLENIKNMINLPMWSNTFASIFIWTIIWAISASVTCYFIGLLIAIFLNSKWVKYKKFWRTVFILPYAVPAMISLMVWYNLLNGQFGPINLILKDAGIINTYFGVFKENIGWLSDTTLARVMCVVVNLWLGFPYFMALLTGTLTSISDDLYEAADIDGATSFQKFKSITFPMVLSATSPVIVMTLATNFNNFGSIYYLTRGNPTGIYDGGSGAGGTDILITWIYKLTVDTSRYNIAALMSLVIFVIVGTFSIWNFRRTNAFKEEL